MVPLNESKKVIVGNSDQVGENLKNAALQAGGKFKSEDYDKCREAFNKRPGGTRGGTIDAQ